VFLLAYRIAYPMTKKLVSPASDYDKNGVDLTLVRACLEETPLQRLQALEEMSRFVESVERGGKPLPSSD
jgi:hypothetical protein